jgi:hypothetical protein
MELISSGYTVQGLAQGIPPVAKGAVGRRASGANDNVGARLVCEFLNHGTDRARWPHLGKDGGSGRVWCLDLEAGRGARDKALDDNIRWQRYAYVQSAVRGGLVAAPRYSRGRQPSAFQFSLA